MRLTWCRKMDAKMVSLLASRDLSRTWIHVDLDAFFASVEELDDPELVRTPPPPSFPPLPPAWQARINHLHLFICTSSCALTVNLTLHQLLSCMLPSCCLLIFMLFSSLVWWNRLTSKPVERCSIPAVFLLECNRRAKALR